MHKNVAGDIAEFGRRRKMDGALYISEGTVKHHVKAILTKLGAIGRAEAIAIAARRGLINLGQQGKW
jgi:two-component system, NarL family, response regulator